MKTVILYFAFAILTLCANILNAQESEIDKKLAQLEQFKTEITSNERKALKKEVEAINSRLDTGEITSEEAKVLKEKAAQKRALNIENQIAIVNNKIALVKRNGLAVEENTDEEYTKLWISLGGKDPKSGDVLFGLKLDTNPEKDIKYDRRTTSELVVAFGLNNAIAEGQSLDQLDYKIAGSRFFELGWAWKTRVFKNSNFLRFKYGISYQSNGLKPTDNRYFVENGNQTELQEFGLELDKSKFRLDHLVIPLHFEFGPSGVRKSEKSIRYSTHNKFRIGLGGYAGARISTRQKLKYKENGDKIKDKIKRDYNTNDLVYGLSGYIGFNDTSLYIKYDMSPIFKNAAIDQNNVSLGVRFDL